ncbi:hypothetical protein B0H14DRAFT_2964044 [Mycena olivaceomarginata]|nr:hypothetical protein B0H14DRAFT_2964044 [Mycena olivaceomarginata]
MQKTAPMRRRALASALGWYGQRWQMQRDGRLHRTRERHVISLRSDTHSVSGTKTSTSASTIRTMYRADAGWPRKHPDLPREALRRNTTIRRHRAAHHAQSPHDLHAEGELISHPQVRTRWGRIHGVFGHEKKANSRSRAYCATARTHPQDPACAGGARDSPRHRHCRGRNTSGLRTALGGLHTTADAGGRAAALRSRSKTRLAPTEVPHAGGHVHSFTFRRGQRRDGSTFILTSPRTDSRRCDPFFEGGGEGWDPRGPDRARHGGPSGQDRYGVAVGWAKVPTRRHGAVYPGHCPRLRVTMGE